MFALMDCNNFYASCERLFRPDLRTQAIVVLSSGDGCVIARSNEAKAIGIKMGEPYFKIKAFCQQHRIHIFSSNFTLYRDLSQRVMSIIEGLWEHTEIYSVDEAFLDLSSLCPSLQENFCMDLQKHLLKCTGIPVSIGLGQTKTLAKLSNYIAKKQLKVPVFNIMRHLEWLKKVDTGDVWGIGQQWQQKLQRQGITSAYDLAQMDLRELRKKTNIMITRTAMELQGTPCFELEPEDNQKKSILSSRSFGTMQTELETLTQAVSHHCMNVYEKLREQNSLAYTIAVFLRTNYFRQDLPQHTQSAQVRLITPTQDIRSITQHAKRCLQKIYKPGFNYKKAGVWLTDLVDSNYQPDLFQPESECASEKNQAFLNVLDKINDRFGQNTLHLGSLGFNNTWGARLQHKSPAYTTRWSELPTVRNNT